MRRAPRPTSERGALSLSQEEFAARERGRFEPMPRAYLRVMRASRRSCLAPWNAGL